MSSRSKRPREQAAKAAADRRRNRNAVLGGIVVVGVLAVAYSVSLWPASRRRGEIAYGEELPRCPVGDMPVDLAVSLDVADGIIYFCCPHCIDKCEAEPAAYADAVEAQRHEFAQRARVQVRCPMDGEPLLGTNVAESNGADIRFCGEDCWEAYRADPGAYAANLAAAFTYQTKCPVSGEPIDPAVRTTVSHGAEVYFCSARCRQSFEEDPAAYWEPLAEQGLRIHVNGQ